MGLLQLHLHFSIVVCSTCGERRRVIPQSDILIEVVVEIVEYLWLLVQEVVLYKVVGLKVEENVALSVVKPN